MSFLCILHLNHEWEVPLAAERNIQGASKKRIDSSSKPLYLIWCTKRIGGEAMPFCTRCGKEVPEGVPFCTNCGQGLEIGSAPEERQPPTQASMPKYEYETITLAQKGLGWFSSKKVPELEGVLNREARLGWRLCQLMMPSGLKGESDKVILVFERELH